MIASLFPPGIECAEGSIASLQESIAPAEESCTHPFVPKRRREFIAGRVCARRALARLGIDNFALLPGPDRYPGWPPGVVGCISHSKDYCAVAAARLGQYSSVGLDVESRDALDSELWQSVFMAPELRWLDGQPEEERVTWATVLFSAKECVYKCQYPVFGEIWGFKEVAITLEAGERFTVKTPGESRLSGVRIGGRYRICNHSVVTAMVLNRPMDGR
jgi:4'-phosphopantetheinyl transferase EntD